MLNDLFPALVSLSFIGVVFLAVFVLDLRRAREHRAAVAEEKSEFTKRSAFTFVPRSSEVISEPVQ